MVGVGGEKAGHDAGLFQGGHLVGAEQLGVDQHIPAAGRLFAGGQKLGRRPVPAAAAEQLGPAGIGQGQIFRHLLIR